MMLEAALAEGTAPCEDRTLSERARSDPGLALYLREVQREPPLSMEEEDDLVRRSRRGDRKARDVLMRRSLRLVPVIAEHYEDQDADLLDLIEQGNLGLLRAVETYGLCDGPFYVHAVREICRAIEAFLKPDAEV